MGVKYGKISSTFTGSGTNTGNLLYFYHPDHLGSSSLITGSGGDVLQHIEYVPYGEVFIEEKNASWRTPYKFNAKELDEETGLYYYGARYYDPKTSVWISVDPLAEENPNVSSYNYCHNNPVRFIDPTGMYDTEAEVAKVAAKIGAEYHRDNTRKTNSWFVSMDETGKKPYTTGGTVTKDFGPQKTKKGSPTTGSTTYLYKGQTYYFPSHGGIIPYQSNENYLYFLSNRDKFKNDDGTYASFDDVFMSEKEIRSEVGLDMVVEFAEMFGAETGGDYETTYPLDLSDLADKRLIPAAKYEKWRYNFPARGMSEKMKMNIRNKEIQEMKLLQSIPIQYLDMEESGRLDYLEKKWQKK